jgi:hypothetical protein
VGCEDEQIGAMAEDEFDETGGWIRVTDLHFGDMQAELDIDRAGFVARSQQTPTLQRLTHARKVVPLVYRTGVFNVEDVESPAGRNRQAHRMQKRHVAARRQVCGVSDPSQHALRPIRSSPNFKINVKSGTYMPILHWREDF